MAEQDIHKTTAVKATDGNIARMSDDLTLETMILMINTNKVRALEDETRKELKELQTRQGHVRYLHKLLTGINSSTDGKGNFNFGGDADLKQLLSQAKDLGVDIDLSKTSYAKDERDRLVENVRLTCEDLNTQNEMQLQTITRITNERYEMYQMARSILKPLHEDKINKARSMSGR